MTAEWRWIGVGGKGLAGDQAGGAAAFAVADLAAAPLGNLAALEPVVPAWQPTAET